MAIQKVGVLGCGLMGSGIAQVSAEAGFTVVVREVDQALVDKGLKKIEGFLAKGVEKGKVTEAHKRETLARIRGTLRLEDLKDCDIVIEAVVEDIALKNEMFAALHRLCPAHTLFATNTSSLSVTEMAQASGRPDRVVGLHFFNPVPLMKLVEVVRTILTSREAYQEALAFARALGKVPVEAKDSCGFIVNFLLVPYLLGAVRALERGVASIPDIDNAMMLGCGYPMGPLTLLDFVGIDTTYRIANIMFEEYREPQYAPPPLLRKMFLAGYHGRKTGRGFYDYSGPEPKPVDLAL